VEANRDGLALLLGVQGVAIMALNWLATDVQMGTAEFLGVIRQLARYMAGELTPENLRAVLDILIAEHPAECADALARVLEIQEDWRYLVRKGGA
jgi:hypothetical protein